MTWRSVIGAEISTKTKRHQAPKISDWPAAAKPGKADPKFCPLCRGDLRRRYREVRTSYRSDKIAGRRYRTSKRKIFCCMTCKVIVQLFHKPAAAFSR